MNKSSIQRAAVLREDIRDKIKAGDFDYADFFPDSRRAGVSKKKSGLIRRLLQNQLEIYERQVQNGQMSPSTYNGYAKVSATRKPGTPGLGAARSRSGFMAWLVRPFLSRRPKDQRRTVDKSNIGVRAKSRRCSKPLDVRAPGAFSFTQ